MADQTKPTQVRVNLMVPENIVALTKRIADIRGTSMSQLIRAALVAHLKQEAAKIKAERSQVEASPEQAPV